jgi:hypothetical protein
MARLEKARAAWKRFEREDQPAFARWKAATFGAMLSRIRELEALLREKESLVLEVEQEMAFGGSRSYRAAYARVQKRRANPDAEPEPPPRSSHGPKFSDDEEMDEFSQELLFEEFLRTFLGMNPDRMSDRQYARMFADFKANLLGQSRPEPADEWDAEPEREFAPEPAAENSVKSGPNRLKELYRLLVRRLHPDTRADNNAEVSALWHDVQEAYEAGNVDRLEMLLAFTDIQSNTAGDHTSLSQMRAVLAELRAAFNALQRNLRAAKKDPAWDFSRLTDRTKAEARLRRELETILDWHEDQIRQLEAMLAQWSAPPSPRQRRRPPSTTPVEFSV